MSVGDFGADHSSLVLLEADLSEDDGILNVVSLDDSGVSLDHRTYDSMVENRINFIVLEDYQLAAYRLVIRGEPLTDFVREPRPEHRAKIDRFLSAGGPEMEALRQHFVPPTPPGPYSSVFVSHGGPDEDFGCKLSRRLREVGVQDTFFYLDNARPGEEITKTMIVGVKRYDKVVLVCSERAFTRGVMYELELVRQREAEQGGKRDILIPVTLDDYVESVESPAETRELILNIKELNLLDFKGAQSDRAKFNKGMDRLLDVLTAST